MHLFGSAAETPEQLLALAKDYAEYLVQMPKLRITRNLKKQGQRSSANPGTNSGLGVSELSFEDFRTVLLHFDKGFRSDIEDLDHLLRQTKICQKRDIRIFEQKVRIEREVWNPKIYHLKSELEWKWKVRFYCPTIDNSYVLRFIDLNKAKFGIDFFGKTFLVSNWRGTLGSRKFGLARPISSRVFFRSMDIGSPVFIHPNWASKSSFAASDFVYLAVDIRYETDQLWSIIRNTINSYKMAYKHETTDSRQELKRLTSHSLNDLDFMYFRKVRGYSIAKYSQKIADEDADKNNRKRIKLDSRNSAIVQREKLESKLKSYLKPMNKAIPPVPPQPAPAQALDADDSSIPPWMRPDWPKVL